MSNQSLAISAETARKGPGRGASSLMSRAGIRNQESRAKSQRQEQSKARGRDWSRAGARLEWNWSKAEKKAGMGAIAAAGVSIEQSMTGRCCWI